MHCLRFLSKIFADILCPSTHPFAFNKGQSCCASEFRKNDPGTNPSYDGTKLLYADTDDFCDDFQACANTDGNCIHGYKYGKETTDEGNY